MANKSSPFINASFSFKVEIASAKSFVGKRFPAIRIFLTAVFKGNFCCKYFSVMLDEIVSEKSFCHFSRIVKMPQRKSAIGRVKVNGNKCWR